MSMHSVWPREAAQWSAVSPSLRELNTIKETRKAAGYRPKLNYAILLMKIEGMK